MINNNPPISPENRNNIQNYAIDKKKEITEDNEVKKEKVRTAAVQISTVQQQEDLINIYLNESDKNQSVDLTGSNVDYSEIYNKYDKYNEQKTQQLQNKYNDLEEKVKDDYVKIQSKGNFVDIST